MTSPPSDAPVIRARVIEDEAFHVTAWERNPKRARSGPLLVLILGAVLALSARDVITEFRAGNPRWWIGWAALLVVIPLFWFWFGPGSTRRRVPQAARKSLKHGSAESWYEFSTAGFLFAGQGGRTVFTPWTEVAGVYRLEDGISILVDPDGYAYYWVPQSSFSSPPEFVTAWGWMKSRAAKAVERPVPHRP